MRHNLTKRASRTLNFTSLAAALLLAACVDPSPGPARTVLQDGDAAPLPPDPCPAAYAHAASVGCVPRPGQTGASWVAVCRLSRAEGSTFGLRCIDAAGTADAVKVCGVDCQ